METPHRTIEMRRRVPLVMTLLLAAAVVGLMASSYVGDSASPYGMCEAANGQQVACAALDGSIRAVPATALPRGASSAVDSIVLERTRCYGTCPAYRLRIDARSAVMFESRNPGDSGAVARKTVAAAWVPDSLGVRLARARLWTLPDTIRGSALCPEYATDHPTITLSVFGARPKHVVYYTGCYLRTDRTTAPPLVALIEVAAAMDTLTGAYRWIQPARGR